MPNNLRAADRDGHAHGGIFRKVVVPVIDINAFGLVHHRFVIGVMDETAGATPMRTRKCEYRPARISAQPRRRWFAQQGNKDLGRGWPKRKT